MLDGKPGLGVKGFRAGSVLALPASFLNLPESVQSQDTWIVHWWQPPYVIVPAIGEENCARLFLPCGFSTAAAFSLDRHCEQSEAPLRALAVAISFCRIGACFSRSAPSQ
jgi:hypothetical protein